MAFPGDPIYVSNSVLKELYDAFVNIPEGEDDHLSPLS